MTEVRGKGGGGGGGGGGVELLFGQCPNRQVFFYGASLTIQYLRILGSAVNIVGIQLFLYGLYVLLSSSPLSSSPS